MKNRKRKEEVGLAASHSAQDSQPSQHHRGRPPLARAAQLVAQQRPRAPRLRSLPLPLDPACQPHVAHARASSRLRLQPLPIGPRMSAVLCFFSTPMLILPSDRTPTAMAGRARGSCPRHGLAPPLALRPRNHAWPSDGVHASDPPQSPAAERRAPWPSSVIKAPAPEP